MTSRRDAIPPRSLTVAGSYRSVTQIAISGVGSAQRKEVRATLHPEQVAISVGIPRLYVALDLAYPTMLATSASQSFRKQIRNDTALARDTIRNRSEHGREMCKKWPHSASSLEAAPIGSAVCSVLCFCSNAAVRSSGAVVLENIQSTRAVAIEEDLPTVSGPTRLPIVSEVRC